MKFFKKKLLAWRDTFLRKLIKVRHEMEVKAIKEEIITKLSSMPPAERQRIAREFIENDLPKLIEELQKENKVQTSSTSPKAIK